jgi:4-methylaminobutanoate oxidase (formaldehyde-forming)
MVDRSLTAAVFTPDARDPLPQRAGTIVVGGGIVGASLAWHLTQEGVEDVLLLEANEIGSGSSWHAAGLITGSRSTATLTDLASYGLDVYDALQERTGTDVHRQCGGSLMLARTSGRVDEAQYAHDVAALRGVRTELIDDPRRLQELWPLARTEGILAALYVPDDGTLNPGHATVALAKLAWQGGAAVREGTRVRRVLTGDGRVTGLETNRGTVRAERVVLACGLWTRDLAATAGAGAPLYAAEHVHVRSHPVEGAHPDLPVIRDLDASYYIRHEEGRLLVGAFEPRGLPRAASGIPTDGFAEFPADWEHFAPIRSRAEAMVPELARVGFDRFLNAPESFTPDANFLLGPTNEVDGLYLSAGYNSQGVIFAPGAGRELARWIATGAPQFDASAVDARRFAAVQNNGRYLHERTREGLGRLYAMHWPQLQPETARDIRRSPVHERLAGLGACFGETNAWERANWYGEPGTRPRYEYSYRRGNAFGPVGEEHRACREGVALFDLSSFTKVEVAGPEAAQVLEQVVTADLSDAALPVGRSVYTLALNAQAGIELDGTVVRLDDSRYWFITPAAAQKKTLGLLHGAARGRAAAAVDVTAGYATLGLFGPQSRDLVAAISPEDFSAESFTFGMARVVDIGRVSALALRISYSGELGWELYPTADQAVALFDDLWAAGEPMGLRPAGFHALDSLRAERGFRHLGHDIGPADDPWSAGLGFTVARSRLEGGSMPFTGQEALSRLDRKNPRRRTLYLRLLEPEPMLFHDEAVLLEGVSIGRVTSGAYGYTVGSSVGLVTVDGTVELPETDGRPLKVMVVCRGRHIPGELSRQPIYDPRGERMRS